MDRPDKLIVATPWQVARQVSAHWGVWTRQTPFFALTLVMP